MNNVQLCKTITEKHVQHFVHLIELHGRKVLYIKFLQTIVKAENQYIKNCQDVVMSEVCLLIRMMTHTHTYHCLFFFFNVVG